MKAVLPGGAEIVIGTVEENPTIGITDYSRRVTDEFGTTRVVERGFARRMSVRVATPTSQVSSIQRQLAAIRATAVRWEADARFAWLNFNGFYKDFSLDLEVGAMSFCTLTVEGLSESEPGADAGGDPSPSGPSSMLLVQPVQITGAMLTASDVPENDYPEWSPAATYAAGVRVIKAATHTIYESAGNGNLAHDPAAQDGMWFEVGPTNRWAMFDEALGTATSRAGGLAVTIAPGAVTAIALLDVVGAAVRVQVGAYDRTIAVANGAATFLDLPGLGGAITVTISGAGTVSVGTLITGKLVTLGITENSPTVGITDFSRKEVDEFGEASIVQRAWAKNMSPSTLIRTDALDTVANRIAAVRARPALWIAQDGTDALTVAGFFKDFSITVGQTVSTVSLSIEGLSEAADFADPIARPAVQYVEGQTYKVGDVVAVPDGSTWLYTNRIATSGNAPPRWPITSDAFWSMMTAPTNRGRLFVLADAPGAAESIGGDAWLDGSGRYWDRRADNHLAIGGRRIMIGGKLLTMTWTPSAAQPVRDGLDAVLVTATAASEAAKQLALDAQATADGKVQSFYQTTAPVAEGVGDLWFDTDDGNKQYRWSGSAWVPVQDAKIGDALTAAAGAQATADGKVATFIREAAPVAEGVGDLWFKKSTGELRRWSGAAWGDPLVDLTAAAQVIVVPAPTFTLYRTFDGAVKPDQLPAALRPSVTKGGVDKRTDDSVSYAVTGTGGLDGKVSVDNANGSATKGDVTIANTVTGEGTFHLTVTVGGVSVGTYATQIVTVDDSPPIDNGGAGGTDSTLENVTTTAYAVMTGQDATDPIMDVAIAAGQTLKLNANFKYQLTPADASQLHASMTCKAECSSDNWATVIPMNSGAAEVTGTVSEAGPVQDRVKGEMIATFTKTGLAAGTYKVRLLGKMSAAGTGTLNVQTGSATSSKS